MKVAFFPGCTAQADQIGYEASVRAIMPKLGVELFEMEGAACCGYPPYSSVSEAAWFYSSARDMAIAEGMGVVRATQYEERAGVKTGTGINLRRRPRIPAYTVIISPYVSTSAPPISITLPADSGRTRASTR